MEEITNEYYMKNPAPFEKDSDLVKVTGVAFVHVLDVKKWEYKKNMIA
jgi:hypothetical protein